MKLGALFQLGLTVSVLITVIEAQFIDTDIPLKCPENWIRHESSCYRFIKSPIRPRADALRNCEAYEAELMSVNSMDEHRFIVQELTWQDPQHRRWYISGRQQSPNYWVNEADGSSLNDLNALFLPENQGVVGIPNRDYLAYSYANSRWGLEKVSGDEHLTYICEAPFTKLMNLVAEERSFSYGSDVEDPEFTPRGPYFIRQPADVVYDLQSASDTKDVSMTCRAGGYPAPTYEWFREEYEADKVISRKIFPLTDKRYTLSGGSLIINNPKETTDRGLYYCKATNMFGSVISEAVQLNFGYIGEFNLNRPHESGAQNWGKALNCDPPSYFPDVKFLWSRGRFPDFVEEDKRVFVSQDGALYFSALEHIDIANYSCNVHSLNEGANTGRNGPVFQLSVIDSGHAQQLTIANTFPKVFPGAPVVGRDARLECFAFGYPVPSYNWTRTNSPLPKNHRVESFGRVLIIPKIRMEDQGEYNCRMTNSQGVKEGKIILSVQAEPNFTIPLTDRHMDIHSDLTWTCEAFGMPDVTYQWFKNGETLVVNGSSELTGRYSIQDNILNIKYLDPEKDPGMYQCRAMNALKTRYSSAQLRVLAFRPSFKRRPLDTEIYAGEGRKVTIFCNPEAAPRPKFEWRKDGNLLGSGGPRMMINGNLTINPVSRSDAGIYVCHATNVKGGDTTSTRLTVLRLPQFIDTLPAKINVIVGQNLDLRCYVTSEDRLDVAYIWTHNGLKLHTLVQVYSAVTVNSGTLSIYNVTYANAGEYECIAKTVVGSVETRTTIYVEGPPSSPGGLQVSEVIRRNVKLQWTDGSPNGRSILYYIVSGRTSWDSRWLNLSTISNGDRTRSVDLFSDRKEAVIEDAVTPWAQYEFRLQAINEIGSSPLSEPSPKANIPADRPYVAPSHVSGGGGKIGDLTITWTPLPPWQQNGPGTHYKIFWRRRGDEKEFQMLELGTNMTKEGVAIVPISPEYYYTEYDVKVQAMNDIGSGPESEIASIYSAEDIPHVQPQSMFAMPFNSTALNASWSPVPQTRENIRGKLIGYRLKYWREDSIEDSAVYYLSRHTRPWALIVGLQPNTTYYVKVMAFNGAGAGPESERILERTYHKAPQQPPTSVFIKGINPSTIKVTWRYVSPNRDEEPLTGYKVRVWPMGEDISRAQDEIVLIGSKLEAYVHGLSVGKRYSLRVLAFSNGGDGRMSSPELHYQMGREESFVNSANRKTYSLLFSICLIYAFTKFV